MKTRPEAPAIRLAREFPHWDSRVLHAVLAENAVREFAACDPRRGAAHAVTARTAIRIRAEDAAVEWWRR